VGLEIKHEILRGELANPRRLALPVLTALAGVAAPALIYLAFNQGPNGAPQGWATPAATDIAFALTALSLVGRGLPPTLRTFLPREPKRPGGEGVLSEVMDALHPYVAYLILPLFALTAAGFAFRGDLAERVLGPISLGVAAGLFLGKQIGVFGAAALVIGLKW